MRTDAQKRLGGAAHPIFAPPLRGEAKLLILADLLALVERAPMCAAIDQCGPAAVVPRSEAIEGSWSNVEGPAPRLFRRTRNSGPQLLRGGNEEVSCGDNAECFPGFS